MRRGVTEEEKMEEKAEEKEEEEETDRKKIIDRKLTAIFLLFLLAQLEF